MVFPIHTKLFVYYMSKILADGSVKKALKLKVVKCTLRKKPLKSHKLLLDVR